MEKNKIVTIVLGVLLIFAVSYIIFDKYSISQEQEKFRIYQEGIQFGYQQAILQIMNQAMGCQQIPLYAGNETLNRTVNLIAIECLQMKE